MAEYLIYNKAHWMDGLSEVELADRLKDPGFKMKYDARYQKGDIVEVREDGYWTGKNAKGFNKAAFAVVAVPGKILDRSMMDDIKDPENDAIILRRRKHAIPADGFDLIPDRQVTITEVALDSQLITKTVAKAK